MQLILFSNGNGEIFRISIEDSLKEDSESVIHYELSFLLQQSDARLLAGRNLLLVPFGC
jgi:hypothetical protein